MPRLRAGDHGEGWKDFMNYFFVVATQVLIMLLYIAAGYLLFRKGLITGEGSKSIANLLLYCILPCVIVKSFCVERTSENTRALLISFFLALALLLLAMAVSGLLLRRNPIDNFGGAFSNAGFMGLPLVTAALGQEAVFYAAGYVALLNILQWTYGQWVLGDRQELRLRALLKNPIILSLLIGLLVFFTQLPVPDVLLTAVSGVSALNAPIAMIVLGVYLANTDLKSMFCRGRLYWVSSVRLLLIPLASLLVLLLLPEQYHEIGVALLLVASTPVGSNVAVYAQKLNLDYTYAVQTVCISTLLSVVTLPLLAAAIGVLA